MPPLPNRRCVLPLTISLLLSAACLQSQSLSNGADTELGVPLFNGDASISGSTLTVTASGADISVHQILPYSFVAEGNYFRWLVTGDGSITARVVSLTDADSYAKAALMFANEPGNNVSYVAMAYAIPSPVLVF